MKKSIFIFLLLIFLPALCLAEQIDINSATLSQLDELTGIGPTYAQRIIDGRPYSSIDGLDKVKGIGPATLQKIKTQGWACVNCQTTATQQSPSPSVSVIPAEAEIQTPSPTPIITYPTGVFINEIMPNPSGADETNEWVELYNSNNFDVALSGWQLQDQQGTITTYIIPSDKKILTNEFLTFKRPDTKIMLNNDSDGLNLLTPDGKTEDFVNFTKSPLNQSYNKTGSGWKWSTTLTPGAANIVTALAPNGLPKIKISAKNNNITESTAINGAENPINSPDSENGANPWLLFFTVVATAIILSAVTLFIKLKLQKNVRT